MAFSLKQALLLSSQNKACSFIVHKDTSALVNALSLIPRYAYRAVVSHHCTGEEKDTFILNLYRITYPEGGREFVVADKPHRHIQKEGLSEFEAYLEKYGFPVDEGWLPMEDEP